MSQFETHNPEKVGAMIRQGLAGDDFDLMDVISDITLEEFRVYMVSKGCTKPIDSAEIEATIRCTQEQAKKINSLLTDKRKFKAEHENNNLP